MCRLFKYVIFISCLFLIKPSYLFSQHIKKKSQERKEKPSTGLDYSDAFVKPEQIHNILQNTTIPGKKVIMISSRYNNARSFVDPNYIDVINIYTNEQQKLIIEKSLKEELNRQFIVAVSNFLLPFISLSLLFTYILIKSNFSNKLKVTEERNHILLNSMIGLIVAFVGLYVYNGLNDAIDKDFAWYIEETWYKGLLLASIIIVINYLFTRLLFSLKNIENIQKLILWISLSIGLIFITKFLNNIADNTNFSTSKSFFDFEENISNWLSAFVIIAVCAYNFFQKNEWFTKSKSTAKEKLPNAARAELQKKYNLGQISFEEYNKEWNKL